jgi:hypothetical protein
VSWGNNHLDMENTRRHLGDFACGGWLTAKVARDICVLGGVTFGDLV